MKKILIVEDDSLLNKTLAYNLTAEGYNVSSAGTYAAAVAHLQKREFDLVLLDINLPDGNGLDLCGEIKGRGQTSYIIVGGIGILTHTTVLYHQPSGC